MINRIEAKLIAVSVHSIGRKAEEEGIAQSSTPVTLTEEDKEILIKYFVDGFREPEFYQFTFSNGDHLLNPVYNFVTNIFDEANYLHEQSVNIARHLYECSNHPNIKSGELLVAYIRDILVDDELTNAIAIVKAENKDAFLKLDVSRNEASIDVDTGLNINKLDKACLIIESERDYGYKVCVIDKSNKAKEAIYWTEDFLNITPRSDDYHTTTHYIKATKSYLKERLPFDEQADKRDEAEILHRSKTYLKNAETFDKEEYVKKVFSEEERQSSFLEFCDDYMQEKKVDLPEQFDISESAVRRQTKYFRSVIKLDKNFHIYAHGDKSLMEKGSDENGKKYYKLYYDTES